MQLISKSIKMQPTVTITHSCSYLSSYNSVNTQSINSISVQEEEVATTYQSFEIKTQFFIIKVFC